jgi:hypothetical protein
MEAEELFVIAGVDDDTQAGGVNHPCEAAQETSRADTPSQGSYIEIARCQHDLS